MRKTKFNKTLALVLFAICIAGISWYAGDLQGKESKLNTIKRRLSL